MTICLQDLVDDPELALSVVVDGDLNRPIRWVHVTELADASPYLEGDELVLTAGVWRGRGTSALEFVRALETRQVAAIGYGLLRDDEPVPRALVRACRDESVPLVVVPVSTPFIAITQQFVRRLTEERERDLQRSLAFTSDILAAADTDDAGVALRQVAGILQESTGVAAWIADRHGDVLASAGANPSPEEARGAIQEALQGRARNVLLIHSGARTAAAIGINGPDATLEARSRLEAAAPVVGLILARQRAVQETERRLVGELVSLVLGRQVKVAAARMSSYGLDPNRPVVALVASITEGEPALSEGERWLATQDAPGIVAVRGADLYVIMGGEATQSPERASQLAESLSHAVGPDAVGIGSVAANVTQLRKSMVQARQACQLGMRRGGGTVVSHELAGSHSLLLALQDQDVLDAFRDTLLSPLEAFDDSHGSELVETLRVFLSAGGRWQAAAESLNVHVNTLRYRLSKVEELSGRRLDNTGDRVDLWLALQTPGPRVASAGA